MTAANGPATRRSEWMWAALVIGGAVLAGHAAAALVVPRAGRMLPWVLGRGLGLAAFVALTLLVAAGLWLRHPWRRSRGFPGPETALRAHRALGAATAVLVAGHIASLALDRYAHVGWVGAFVAGRSGYRPLPVALGTAAVYLFVMVGATAVLAGRRPLGRHWLPVHRLATASFVLVWLHGVTAGSDTATLRPLYLGGAALIAALVASRWVARLTGPRLDRSPA